jgi:signal transduction histidine kinase
MRPLLARDRTQPLLPVHPGPRSLAVTTLGLITASALVNISLALFAGPSGWAWLGPAVGVLGVPVGFASRYSGLALTLLAPVVTVATDLNPAGTSVLAVLSALLLTLRGGQPVVIGVSVATVNMFTTWFFYGAEVFTNPLPSVAAITALLAVAVGSAVRSRAETQASDQQRARDAIASRGMAAKRVVAEERLRIARDLHDSIGHHVAVVNMHVSSAEVQLPPHAEAARTSLAAARSAIQEVLAETQETLRMLRVDDRPEEVTPTARYEGVPDLVSSFKNAGVDVELEYNAASGQLSQAVSAAVYRISQEALTNAQKHGTGRVFLCLNIHDGVVTVESKNSIAMDLDDVHTGGNGLVGMRERVASVGGSLQTRTARGQFSLKAELPTHGSEGAKA